MIAVIIPTLYRDTLKRAIKSVEDYAHPIIESGGTAGENRNKALLKARDLNPKWIVFLDDDDYLAEGWQEELDPSKDIVVFRMLQANRSIIPDSSNELRFANIGINFALNMNSIQWSELPEFDNEHGEDWRFIEKLTQKYTNIKITDKVYYFAPIAQHLVSYGIKSDNPFTDWTLTLDKMDNKQNLSILELGWGQGTNYLLANFKQTISIELSRYLFPYTQLPNHTYIELSAHPDTIGKDDILIETLGVRRPDFTEDISKLMVEIEKYPVDMVFVDFGFHFRGEVVQELINRSMHTYIAYHDTNFPYYGYERLELNGYEVFLHDTNGQGTIVLKR